MEVDLGDSEEEGGNCRRRSGRLAKSQARYKQKANRFRVEEAEEENSKNNERELEEEKHSNSKREKENEEKEKSENSIDNTQVSPIKTIETTHVSTNFTLQPITFCEDNNIVDTSPITISSLVKEKINVFANP